MKRLTFIALISALVVTIAAAQKVEIISKSFFAKDALKQAHFIDDVDIKQDKSWIKCDLAIVYFDDNNQTIQYDAIDRVTFEIIRPDHHYKGKAQKVSYYPDTSTYLFAGDAVVDDLLNNRHMAGNIIVVDTITGDAQIKSAKKKPVKFIFDLKGTK